MPSAVILTVHSYPASTVGTITGTLARKVTLNTLTPTPDMDRTVSRRSEPSSRTALMGEQPNPWDVLPPQDAMSRHRGAKPPPSFCLCTRRSISDRSEETFVRLRYLLGGDRPSQTAHLKLSFHRLTGLTVQAQVSRIFTASSISPSPSSRQLPNHYAIRAGRNLPDKEFRYLRTVIVTAAHWAGVSPHTSFYNFAETCLQSYFAEFLKEGSLALLGILYLPTCVGLSLILGPDSPSVDEPCGGNLRFSEHWILTNVFVTQSDILTFVSSIPAFANTSSYNKTLPYRYTKSLFRGLSCIQSLPRFGTELPARTETYYLSFILAMVRSTGFGSTTSDKRSIQARFHFVLFLFVGLQFHVLFHSPPGVLFTFPSRYYTLSDIQEYLALRGGPRRFTRDSTESFLLSFPLGTKMFQFPRFSNKLLSFLIRTLSDQSLLPTPRNVSPVATSFFASEYQGILYKPLIS
eukprot:gene5539-11160_t